MKIMRILFTDDWMNKCLLGPQMARPWQRLSGNGDYHLIFHGTTNLYFAFIGSNMYGKTLYNLTHVVPMKKSNKEGPLHIICVTNKFFDQHITNNACQMIAKSLCQYWSFIYYQSNPFSKKKKKTQDYHYEAQSTRVCGKNKAFVLRKLFSLCQTYISTVVYK